MRIAATTPKRFCGIWPSEGSAAEMISMTLASVTYESSGPPKAFGTLIDQSPLCENASNSASGRSRFRSRAEAPAAKRSASLVAIAMASASFFTT